MMTEHEPVPGTEYYGDDHYGEPKGKGTCACGNVGCPCECGEQYEDEEEMAQWYEFDAYQDFTDTTAIYPPEKGIEYTALGLASEAGEFAGKVKKWIRDGKKDDDALVAELGDVLWYVAQAAAAMDVHLSDVAKTNVEKLKSRKERNVISGEGDNR